MALRRLRHASVGRDGFTFGLRGICPCPTDRLFYAVAVAARRRGFVREDLPVASQEALRRHGAEELDQEADKPGPPGLMARTESGAVVAMKMLVEQNVVPPMRVAVELRRTAIDGAPPCL